MTQREEFEAWYDGGSEDRDDFAWTVWQAAQAAQNEWKEAVLNQLARHAMDAPVTDSPAVILQKIIDMAVTMATDPQIGGVALMPAWQDISTAPKDGEFLVALIYNGRLCWAEAAHRGKEALWRLFYTPNGGSVGTPSHWMPLPELPAAPDVKP